MSLTFQEELANASMHMDLKHYKKMQSREPIIKDFMELDRYKKLWRKKGVSKAVLSRMACSKYSQELTLMILSKHYYGENSFCARRFKI